MCMCVVLHLRRCVVGSSVRVFCYLCVTCGLFVRFCDQKVPPIANNRTRQSTRCANDERRHSSGPVWRKERQRPTDTPQGDRAGIGRCRQDVDFAPVLQQCEFTRSTHAVPYQNSHPCPSVPACIFFVSSPLSFDHFALMRPSPFCSL